MKLLFTGIEFITFTLVALLVWAAAELGMLMNVIALGLMVAAPLLLIQSIWDFTRGSGLQPFWRATETRSARSRVVTFGVKSSLWVLCLMSLQIAIVPTQLGPDYGWTMVTFWAMAIGSIALDAFPSPEPRRLRLAARALGSVFLGFYLLQPSWSTVDGERIDLDFPLTGDWVVFQGGMGTLINHHYGLRQQRHALDLSRVVEGRIDDPAAEGVRANYSFEAVVYSPADGEVVQVVDAMLDNEGANFEPDQPAGNHVVIKIGPERFVTLAHLQRGSIEVNIGDTVNRGTPVARVGNSGNTTMPHLHLQVNSEADFLSTTSQTFPMRFRNARVERSGEALESDVELRRNDRIIVEEVP